MCKLILDILSFAYAANKHTLVDVIADHVIDHLVLFFRSKEFLEIPFQFLNRLLTDRKCISKLSLLFSVDKRVLDEAIIVWIGYSREERLKYLNQLLELGRYENASQIKSSFAADVNFKVIPSFHEINYEKLISKNEDSLNVFIEQKINSDERRER